MFKFKLLSWLFISHRHRYHGALLVLSHVLFIETMQCRTIFSAELMIFLASVREKKFNDDHPYQNIIVRLCN